MQSRALEDRMTPREQGRGPFRGSSAPAGASASEQVAGPGTSRPTSAEGGADPDEAALPETHASHTRKPSPSPLPVAVQQKPPESQEEEESGSLVGDLRQLGSKRGGVSTHTRTQAKWEDPTPAKWDDKGREGRPG